MRDKKELNIMGLRDLVYGACAGIVLACLAIAVLVLVVSHG